MCTRCVARSITQTIETRRTAIRSPNTVALVEQFVSAIKEVWPNLFILFGGKHMNQLCSGFREHYHLKRLTCAQKTDSFEVIEIR